jgi:30S ribosomal protein 3|tara:strand:+ start:486 stop:803 length:318 start_codon:yes stop_codon:yes gene_type:complete
MIKNQTHLKLKVAWFKNFLGLAIDQVSLDKQQYSLTSYYFWPKTEAWKQLELELDSKLWLNQEEKVKILKTAGDITNYWVSYRNTKSVNQLKEDFKRVEVVIVNE